MITIGLDIGSTTTKAVALKEGTIIGTKVFQTGSRPALTAENAYREILDKCGLDKKDVDATASTGYGRRLAGFNNLIITEIRACAYGINHLNLQDEGGFSVIDVGGQDTKVIIINNSGEVEDFAMNDKCAAGTGRFLEMLSVKLGLSYEDFVISALGSNTSIQMNSTCAVFAESEVVSMLSRGIPPGEIARAAHNAIAERIGSMCRRMGVEGRVSFTGGGAMNEALVNALENVLNTEISIPANPQIITALGAAVFASLRLNDN